MTTATVARSQGLVVVAEAEAEAKDGEKGAWMGPETGSASPAVCAQGWGAGSG